MEQLSFPFCVELKKAGNRRKPRMKAVCDENITSRRDRLEKRNRLIAARYYYWTELLRRRFDDTLQILCDNEFFVESRTISNAISEQDDYLHELIQKKITKRLLKRQYPGWGWD